MDNGRTIINFKLEGFQELTEELHKLSRHYQRKGADRMASAGTAIVKDAAINLAHSIESKDETYWSYIKEGIGDYSGMTITGRRYHRDKAGAITSSLVRRLFQRGHISRSIFMGKSKLRKLQRYATTWRVFVAPQAWFAIFLEYGTNKIPKRSFIRKALKDNINKVLETMKYSLFTFLTEQNLKRLKVTKGW